MHLLGYLNDKALKCQVICNSPLNLKKKWYFSHFGMKYKKNQKNLLGLNSKMDYKGLFAYFQQLMLDGVHCSILQFRKDIVNGSIIKGKKVVTKALDQDGLLLLCFGLYMLSIMSALVLEFMYFLGYTVWKFVKDRKQFIKFVHKTIVHVHELLRQPRDQCS